MAANRIEINRGASPMYYTEEKLEETREQVRDRRSKLEDVRSKKSRILKSTDLWLKQAKILWLLGALPLIIAHLKTLKTFTKLQNYKLPLLTVPIHQLDVFSSLLDISRPAVPRTPYHTIQ